MKRMKPRLGVFRTAPIWRFLMAAVIVPLVFTATAHARGGDVVAPFPVVLDEAGKQEAKGMAVDSAGNVVVVGYTNNGVSNDWHLAKFKADGSGTAWPPVTYAGGAEDVATAVAVDSAGDIIVTGYIWSGSDKDIHTIKYNGGTGEVMWQHTLTNASGDDYPMAIAVDGSNNIYIAGSYFNGPSNDDYLIIKYPSAGDVPTWVEIYDDPAFPNGINRILAIAAGADGIAVTGYSRGATHFNILTRKYGFDKSLVRQWRHSGSGDCQGKAVRIDADGKVIMSGSVTNAANNKDIATVKYDPTADTPQWEAVYDGKANDDPKALWVDSSGNVYVTGSTETLAGNDDFYTACYSGAGAKRWDSVHDVGSGSTDVPVGIVVDNAADGGVFVTGYTTVSTTEDLYTVKYKKDSVDNGTLIWGRVWNGTGNKSDRPVGIAIDPLTRNVVVAGWSDGATGYNFVATKYDYGKLNAPTNLSAVAASSISITLTWADNSGNEEKFVIQRKLGEGGTFADITTTPAILGPGTITYTDPGLTTNSYYYYRVRANNATDGDSDYSNEARALTKVVTYDAPLWKFFYNGADNLEDIATAITVDADNNPVVTGYSDLTEEGVEASYSYDYMTFKLDRNDDSRINWKARYDSGDGGTDMAAGVALDSAGNALVTGTAYLSGGSEKSDDLYTRKVATAGLSDPAAVPAFIWDHQYGTQSGIDLATAISMVRDGSNNSVVIGHGQNGAGNDDIFIIKYNNDGTRPWVPIVYNSGRNDHPSAVAIDAAGNIFVAGHMFDSQPSPLPPINFDWYTAKYNGATGELIWADTFDSENGDDIAFSIDVDKAGNAYVTGSSRDAGGKSTFYTIKYDGAPLPDQKGRRIWEKSFNYVGLDAKATAVKVDPIDGAVVVAGTAYVSPTDSDFNLIRYNPADGSVIWQRNFDAPATYDYFNSMTLDSSGYIYVAGNTRNGPDSDSAFNASSNIMSLIYDFEGTFLGAMTYNGAANSQDEVSSITVNLRGEAFVAGTSKNAANNDYMVIKHSNSYILVPAPFTATAQANYTQVALAWQTADPATSFRIERTPGPSHPLSVWTHVTSPGVGSTGYTDTVASPGTSYCYRIDAAIGALNSRKTETCVTTRLQAPALDPLTVDSTTQMTLSWSQVAGNTGYKVERKIGAGSWSDLITKGTGVNSHVDLGLSPGTTYYYRVSTNSVSGYSAPCSERSAITKPAQPTLSAPASITNTQMVLGWGAVTGAASYTLQYKVAGGVYANFAGCINIAGTSCTVTGLTAPNQYFFQVKAANTGGESTWSNETNAVAALAVPALTNPIAAATITNTSMTVAWTNPVISGANVTSYTLEYKEGAGAYVGSGCPANTNLNCNVTGLLPNKTYTFHVRAENAAGSSNWSTEVSAKTKLPATVITAAAGASASTITLTWDAVAEATGYSIEQSSCNNSDSNPASCRGTVDANYAVWGVKTTVGAVASTTITGLAAGTNYRYRITATVAGNTSAVSNVMHAWTNLAAPVLTVTPAGVDRLDLSWGQLPGETNYAVETGPSLTGPWTVLVAAQAANVATYSHTGLELQTVYCYQVKAYSTEANPPPATYSAAVCKPTPPAAPTLATLSVVSSAELGLSWSQVPDNTGYEVERCPSSAHDNPAARTPGTCATLSPKVGTGITTFANIGLSAGYTYRYRVRATYGTSDVTAWSNESWATTTPPAPPMVAPAAGTATTTQLTPTWTNINGDNGYKLYWKTRSGADCTAGAWNGPISLAINTATYNHAGLTPGTFYCYYATANGPVGPPVTPDSVASNVVSQTTKPSTPVLDALTGVTNSKIDLAWANVTGNSGYKIERKTGASGSWSTVVTTVADATSYSNTGLAAGTLYYYRISANSNAGFSGLSNEQYATTTPAAPSPVTATVISADEVDLSWSVVVGATNYKIERKEEAGAYAPLTNQAISYSSSYCGEPYPTIACPSLSPSAAVYQDTGLKESTSYCYQIKAWNGSGGDSLPSTEKCVTTSALARQDLVGIAVNSFKIVLTWAPLACAPNPCDNPDWYEVERLVWDGNWVWHSRTLDGATLTFTDTIGISPNKQYSYRVRAIKGGDRSPYSNTATVSTLLFQSGDTTCK